MRVSALVSERAENKDAHDVVQSWTVPELQTTSPPEETFNGVNSLACGWYQTDKNAWAMSGKRTSVSSGKTIPLHTKAIMQKGECLHAQHTKREDHRISQPVHCPVMQKVQVQAPAHLLLPSCRWAPQMLSIRLFLALWILDYLLQWSSLRSPNQLLLQPSF